MYLVLKYCTGLLMSLMALLLSHSNFTLLNLTPKSSNMAFIYSNCAQQLLALMYSASKVDSATLFWFFEDHDMSDLVSSWHVPLVLFLSTLQLAKFESTYPINLKFAPLGYHNPTFCVPLRYLNILLVAFKWLSLGEAWNLTHMHTLNMTSSLDTVT